MRSSLDYLGGLLNPRGVLIRRHTEKGEDCVKREAETEAATNKGHLEPRLAKTENSTAR